LDVKKIILTVLVSIFMLSPVVASEEIQLAAALGTSTPVTPNKDDDDDDAAIYRPSGNSKYAVKGISDEAIIGAIVVGTLGVIVGSDSATNH
jgi:hypothetical protein